MSKNSNDNGAIANLALRVSDRERASTFYEEVAGFERLGDEGGELRLGPPGGSAVIRLVEAPDAPERGRAEAGLFHLAIRFPDRESLSHSLGRIERAGYPLAGASDHKVSEALYMSDPDGNGVEFYVDRPESEWEYRDDEVVMTTERLDIDGLYELAAEEPERKAPAGTDLGHVHLEVPNLQDAVGFYRDALGMEIQARRPGAAFLSYGGYHHHVAVNTWNRRSSPRTAEALGAWEYELAVDDRLYDDIRERCELEAEPDASLETEDPARLQWRIRRLSGTAP